MCGIVGYIGKQEATNLLVDGLRRLEYRGYDSAGVAILGRAEGPAAAPGEYKLQVVRCRGKLSELEALLQHGRPTGHVGIGHTRWATHGRPSDENAHPHCYKTVAVVHNGIIENYLQLQHELSARGHTFQSQTDTEIIAHLIQEELEAPPSEATEDKGDRLLQATRRALRRVEGAYAIVVLSTAAPERGEGAHVHAPARDHGEREIEPRTRLRRAVDAPREQLLFGDISNRLVQLSDEILQGRVAVDEPIER